MTVQSACSICIEDYSDLELGSIGQLEGRTVKVIKTPCGHLYHTDCIEKWVNQPGSNANCPNCRKPLIVSHTHCLQNFSLKAVLSCAIYPAAALAMVYTLRITSG